MTCTLCDQPIESPLYDYGDPGVPLCFSCAMTPQPWDLELYRHEPHADGRGHTTYAGRDYAMFFECVIPDEPLAIVRYGGNQ